MDQEREEQLSPFRQLVRALFTEDAIYGLILVSGMIVISGSLTGETWGAFATVSVTVVVFWAAHVYARALSHYAGHGEKHNLRRAIGQAVYESRGMLIVSVPPLLVLLAGLTRVVDDEFAIMLALFVDVALLAIVGWIAVARWSLSGWARAGGALLTAMFGLILIGLKAIIH